MKEPTPEEVWTAWRTLPREHVLWVVEALRRDGFSGEELERIALERVRVDYHEHLVDLFMEAARLELREALRKGG